MDLDIDPAASVDQFFPSILIHDLIHQYACSPDWLGRLEFDDTPAPQELDPGQGKGNVARWYCCSIIRADLPAGLMGPAAHIRGFR